MTTNTLQPTAWLAKRLGLSVSTIERLRAFWQTATNDACDICCF